METDKILTDYARSIASRREELSTMRLDESADLQGAHRRMRQLGKLSFRAAGVEFVRVPGEERLRVRTSKQPTSAETHDPVETAEIDALPDDLTEPGSGFDEDAQTQEQ